jgi:serpin B
MKSTGHYSAILTVTAMYFLSAAFSSSQASQIKVVAEANNSFAMDLYAGLRSQHGNLFFSPYSISSCLAMAYAGARGDTEKQMAAVLHLNLKQEQVHAGFGELQRRLNDAKRQSGIELSVANGLWAQQGHKFLPEFLNVATRQYQAELRQADFKTQADAATMEINSWVSKQTRDRIKNILPPGALDLNTRLVLANAIYFKGSWAKAFVKGCTTPEPFYLSFTDKVDVPTMSHEDDVRYAENDSFQAVELPYKGD